jgi:hypothetical protein
MKLNKFFLAFVALLIAVNGAGLIWLPAQAAAETLTKKFEFGKEYDVSFGQTNVIGMYTPSSAYNGTLEMIMNPPDASRPFKATGMQFVGQWVDVSMLKTGGGEFTQVAGLLYLYFNLTAADRKLWDEGRLGIYRHVAEDKDWEACEVQVFLKNENKPNGRLACVLSDFGMYTLASAPTGNASEIIGETLSQRVEFSKRYDLWIGIQGIFMPRSAFNGRLEYTVSNADNTKPFTNMAFESKWVDLRMYNSSGKAFSRAYGLNYVYFNMTAAQRTQWDKGKLSIYHWDETDGKWEACPVVILLKNENKPNGRLACVIKEFGLYTMASKP